MSGQKSEIRVNKHTEDRQANCDADKSREPIRDETLREGLIAVEAVLRREDLPTMSGLPRYVLKAAFAALFDPVLAGTALEAAIAVFQTTHLTKLALACVSIMLSGATGGMAGVLVCRAEENQATGRNKSRPLELHQAR